MSAKLVFTENDAIALMHKERRDALRVLADYFEKHNYDLDDTVRLMREIADEADAQMLVVKLRDDL